MAGSSPKIPGPHIPVEVDLSYATNHVPGSRQAEIDAAIESILQRFPAEHRAEIRAALEDPNGWFTGASDPEIARSLKVIMSIRAADAIAEATAAGGLPLAPPPPSIPVVVALVRELPKSGARAVVVRDPGDEGRPLLLLSERDATSADVRRGLRAAALARERYGPTVSEKRVWAVRSRPGAKDPFGEAGDGDPVLPLLRKSELTTIPGIGTVRALVVGARPARR